MMKKTIICTLVLFLIIAVIPRNSSARGKNPHDNMKEEVPAESSGPIVNITTASNIIFLTEIFNWLQHNMPSYQKFNETIEHLNKDISNLPSELVVNRKEILRVLFNSQDRFHEARTILIEAATKLESYCDETIYIIEGRKTSERELRHTANKFVRDLTFINGVLKDALTKLIGLNEIFSDLKDLLINLNTTLNSEVEKINKIFENKEDISTFFGNAEIHTGINIHNVHYESQGVPQIKYQDSPYSTFFQGKGESHNIEYPTYFQSKGVPQVHYQDSPYSTFFQGKGESHNIPYPTYSQIEGVPQIQYQDSTHHTFSRSKRVPQIILNREIERNNNLAVKIKKAQKSISALLSQIVKINEYIVKENEMITKRQINSEDIEFKLKSSKVTIIALKNACSSYSSGA